MTLCSREVLTAVQVQLPEYTAHFYQDLFVKLASKADTFSITTYGIFKLSGPKLTPFSQKRYVALNLQALMAN